MRRREQGEGKAVEDGKRGRITHLLHGSRKVRASICNSLVDVFFPGDLVAHLDSILEKHRVCVLCLLLVCHGCD